MGIDRLDACNTRMSRTIGICGASSYDHTAVDVMQACDAMSAPKKNGVLF